MFLPHVIWQIAHGWPTLEFIRNASSDKMQANTPLCVRRDQVMNMNPLTLPIWLAGLVYLLCVTQGRGGIGRWRGLPHRCGDPDAQPDEPQRLSRRPRIPVLFAAGGVLRESLIHSRAARTRASSRTVLLAAGAVTAPLAVPILCRWTPTSATARALGIAPLTEEKKAVGRLPQFFADRQGWDAFVDQVAAAWTG